MRNGLIHIYQQYNPETKEYEPKSIEIGKIQGFYGGLEVMEYQEKFYWGIHSHSDIEWQEIPKYLYDSLVKFQKGE